MLLSFLTQSSSFLTPFALADTSSSLQDSKEGMVSVSEVHELLTKNHGILDNGMSKQIGNTACTLARFNSACR